MAEYCFRVTSSKDKHLSDFGEILDNFAKKLTAMNLTPTQNDEFIRMSLQLLNANKDLCEKLLDAKPRNASKVLNDSYQYACSKMKEFDTAYKRKNKMKQSAFYVEPEEKAIGYKMSLVTDTVSGKSCRKYVQSTFQYISIFKQLQSIFADAEFCQLYTEYNTTKKHTCIDGTYRDFCCGSNYQRKDFFSSNSMPIQIQLFTDDFEPCDALKSRVGVHKMCAFYFHIRNLPTKLLSKLNNIFLVALCKTDDLKNEFTSLNNILEVIVNDIKFLENVGISVNGKNIKATLVNVSFDNLGGNSCFGFSESFRANFFCRICKCHRDDCQKMTVECESEVRTKDNYDETIAVIQTTDSDKIDLTSTKGVKRYCILNDLNWFHILENPSVDLMHDLHEGIIPFLLQNLFEYIIKKKIINLDRLENMIHYFNYGALNKKNSPSKINLCKRSIGQSAHQSYCLMINIPFILIQFKNELASVWKPVETLLQIMQIIFSDNIDENDLIRLTALIDSHLTSLIDVFEIRLLPKHHFLLHYPRVIRAMGPVILMWTMRMEAKHHFFKELVRKKKNFINLTKTLSYKHQEVQFVQGYTFDDVISPGKIQVPFDECEDFEKYSQVLRENSFSSNNIQELYTVKSLNINNSMYRPGLLIVIGSRFYEIEYILSDSCNYWLLCYVSYIVQDKDLFCNSLVLQKFNERACVFNPFELNLNKTYEIMYVRNEKHVKAESLNLYYL